LYEKKLSSLAAGEVEEACSQLKPLRLDELGEDNSKDYIISLGTTLFELYLGLKQFSL